MNVVKVLIVDDDTNTCQLLNLYLLKENYSVDICHNGEDALAKIRKSNYDLMILDIMMPIMDGYDTLRELRSFSNMPVIMLSAKGEAMDKINALDYGADDYVTKPFESQELISRIKAILRRSAPKKETSSDLVFGNLVISLSDYSVKINGEKIEMPPKEIELLHFLALHPMKVFTRMQLLEQVWVDFKGDARTVDVHIKRLREKLGENSACRLTTVWGVGYKFEEA